MFVFIGFFLLIVLIMLNEYDNNVYNCNVYFVLVIKKNVCFFYISLKYF